VYEGFTVSMEYDPMLGKLISWGQDRAEAIARLDRALEEHSVTGIKTNSGLLLGILRDPEFLRGEIFTRWLDERLPQLLGGKQAQERDVVAEDAAILAALLHSLGAKDAVSANGDAAEAESRWKREARFEQVDRNERRSGKTRQ
jgi:acetyl/propionyl-CoA carboxylase alpha subunit